MLLIYKVVAAQVEFVLLGGVFDVVEAAAVTTFFALFNVS